MTNTAFEIFEKICVGNDLIQDNEDIFNTIGEEQNALWRLVYLCKDQIGLREEDVIPYHELIKMIGGYGISLPMLQRAVKTLSNALVLTNDEAHELEILEE